MGKGHVKTKALIRVLWLHAQNSHQNTEEARDNSLLKPFKGAQPCQISDFWPPKPWENTFVLRCQVYDNLYSSLSKLIHCLSSSSPCFSPSLLCLSSWQKHSTPRPNTWSSELINIIYWVLRMYLVQCWVLYVHSSHLILILTQPSTWDTVISHFIEGEPKAYKEVI